MKWRVLLTDEVLDFSRSLTKRRYLRLRAAIQFLVANPLVEPESETRPQGKREMFVITLNDFRITFWVDFPVKEIVVEEVKLA